MGPTRSQSANESGTRRRRESLLAHHGRVRSQLKTRRIHHELKACTIDGTFPCFPLPGKSIEIGVVNEQRTNRTEEL